MLHSHLYAHNLQFTALFIIGLSVGISLLGQWVFHRYVPLSTRLAHNQVIGSISATCALIYVVLLAFIASTVWISYDRAEEAVSREAAMVVDLFQDASILTKPLEPEAMVDLRDYARSVVNDEWPRMAEGQPTKSEDLQRIQGFYRKLIDVRDATPVQVAVIQEMISRVNQLYDIRRERLRIASQGSLKPAVWMVVLLGGMITIVFCWFLGFEKNWIHVLSTIMVAITLGLVLSLIVVFNRPFRGRMQISPAPFEDALKHMDERVQAGIH